MQAVITSKQAKQITGGRTPLVPIEYERALESIKACTTFEEAKYWDTEVDKLAAWANIYHQDKVSIEARRLKLHAFRRMGEIAEKLQPIRYRPGAGNSIPPSKLPGPVALLRDNGLSKQTAHYARKISQIDPRKFDQMVRSKNPPTVAAAGRPDKPRVWQREILLQIRSGRLLAFANFCRENSAKELARFVDEKDSVFARNQVKVCQEWLDELEQYLP